MLCFHFKKCVRRDGARRSIFLNGWWIEKSSLAVLLLLLVPTYQSCMFESGWLVDWSPKYFWMELYSRDGWIATCIFSFVVAFLLIFFFFFCSCLSQLTFGAGMDMSFRMSSSSSAFDLLPPMWCRLKLSGLVCRLVIQFCEFVTSLYTSGRRRADGYGWLHTFFSPKQVEIRAEQPCELNSHPGITRLLWVVVVRLVGDYYRAMMLLVLNLNPL